MAGHGSKQRHQDFYDCSYQACPSKKLEEFWKQAVIVNRCSMICICHALEGQPAIYPAGSCCALNLIFAGMSDPTLKSSVMRQQQSNI